MNDEPQGSPHPPAATPGSPRPFDPCEERLTSRDWSFLAYLLALGVLPLIAAVAICLWIYSANPNFDNFPKGPAPLGPAPPVISVEEISE